VELSGVADDVIGREHNKKRFRIAPTNKFCCGANRRRRITSDRFKNNIGLDSALLDLFGDAEAEIGMRYDDRSGEDSVMRNPS